MVNLSELTKLLDNETSLEKVVERLNEDYYFIVEKEEFLNGYTPTTKGDTWLFQVRFRTHKQCTEWIEGKINHSGQKFRIIHRKVVSNFETVATLKSV